MRISRFLAVLTLAAAVNACSDGPTVPLDGETITLSATQAAELVGRVEAFGAADPTLQSLSDTVGVVLKAGADAKRIEITTDLGATTFYAVSLHRSGPASSPWSTFHMIAFDDPSAPSHFIILGGWTSTASNTVSGPIGGGATTSLTAHLFKLSGDQLSSWHASTGTISLAALEMLALCSGDPGAATCFRGSMDATFSITGTVAGNGTSGQRTASGTVTGVPGIRLGH